MRDHEWDRHESKYDHTKQAASTPEVALFAAMCGVGVRLTDAQVERAVESLEDNHWELRYVGRGLDGCQPPRASETTEGEGDRYALAVMNAIAARLDGDMPHVYRELTDDEAAAEEATWD